MVGLEASQARVGSQPLSTYFEIDEELGGMIIQPTTGQTAGNELSASDFAPHLASTILNSCSRSCRAFACSFLASRYAC